MARRRVDDARAGAVLVFINNIIIPYTVWIGAQIDTLAVNTLGLPVNSGMVVFALALILGLGWASWKAHRRGRVVLNILLLSTTMILVGFSSYASMTIRAAANPPMNSNNPNNPHALLAVLNRDQYGSRPLLYGPYFSAPPEALVEKEVTYLDEDGRYKTARIPSHYTHAPEFMHLFPACGTPTRTNGSTNSGAPTAPAPRSHATKTARRSATSRGVRCGRRCSTSAAGAPIRTPTATRAP